MTRKRKNKIIKEQTISPMKKSRRNNFLKYNNQIIGINET